MSRRALGDGLLLVQLLCTGVFGGSQFIRMQHSVQGVGVMWFLFWEIFLLLNLVLAVKAHRAQPSRVTAQTIISYAAWTAVITMDLALIILRHTSTYDRHETATLMLGITCILLTVAWSECKDLGVRDPMVRGWMAVSCKAVPQVVLACKLWSEGSAGMAGAAILTGHITVLTRLCQLGLSLREAGWDRNRRALVLAESANELTWCLVTAAWWWA